MGEKNHAASRCVRTSQTVKLKRLKAARYLHLHAVDKVAWDQCNVTMSLCFQSLWITKTKNLQLAFLQWLEKEQECRVRSGGVDANLACEYNLFALITAAADLQCAAVVWPLPDCGLSCVFTSLITSCLLRLQSRLAPSWPTSPTWPA